MGIKALPTWGDEIDLYKEDGNSVLNSQTAMARDAPAALLYLRRVGALDLEEILGLTNYSEIEGK